jgi:hypothetical protein
LAGGEPDGCSEIKELLLDGLMLKIESVEEVPIEVAKTFHLPFIYVSNQLINWDFLALQFD